VSENAASLTVKTEAAGATCTVVPIGDVDLTGSPVLKVELRNAQARLAGQPGARLIVDLAGVPYMDSSGLATLVEAMQASRKAGAGFKLVLCALQPRVRAIMEIARTHSVFTIVATRDQALTV
jgi:anti-sigma B factor antagonist